MQGFKKRRHGLDEPPKQFTGRLTRANIYGKWRACTEKGLYAVQWGRFWAYAHQFDASSQLLLIEECKTAQYQRDYPHVLPQFEE
jgi:hypothetical protein